MKSVPDPSTYNKSHTLRYADLKVHLAFVVS